MVRVVLAVLLCRACSVLPGARGFQGFLPCLTTPAARHTPTCAATDAAAEKYESLKAEGEKVVEDRAAKLEAYEQEVKFQRLKAEGEATVAKRRAMEEVYK